MENKNNYFQSKQIKNILMFELKKYKDDFKDLLIKCMENYGYIIEIELLNESVNGSDNELGNESDNESVNESVNELGNEDYLFAPVSKLIPSVIQGNTRLNKLNIRGMTSEEQDYLDIKTQINEALSKINLPDIDQNSISLFAMSMYNKIKQYSKSIKGKIRRGYIFFIL